jgi:hypothetical protein
MTAERDAEQDRHRMHGALQTQTQNLRFLAIPPTGRRTMTSPESEARARISGGC